MKMSSATSNSTLTNSEFNYDILKQYESIPQIIIISLIFFSVIAFILVRCGNTSSQIPLRPSRYQNTPNLARCGWSGWIVPKQRLEIIDEEQGMVPVAVDHENTLYGNLVYEKPEEEEISLRDALLESNDTVNTIEVSE